MKHNRKHIRAEVACMDWSEVIIDPEGDMEREMKRMRRVVVFWRIVGVCCVVEIILEKWMR